MPEEIQARRYLVASLWVIVKYPRDKQEQARQGTITRRIRQLREPSGLENQMTQRIVPVIVKNILNAYIILMGAYAAINRVRAVTATLYAPQYEHALMLLGSVLFRSSATLTHA